MRRFLLEDMQYVNGLVKTHGINGPVGITVMDFDDFENARMTESFKRLSFGRFAAELRNQKGLADMLLRPLGKSLEIFQTASDPDYRLGRSPLRCHNDGVSTAV